MWRAVDAARAPSPAPCCRAVVPHEACLATLASVMPYLSNSFFSLAMINGEASVESDEAQRDLVGLDALALGESTVGQRGAGRRRAARPWRVAPLEDAAAPEFLVDHEPST